MLSWTVRTLFCVLGVSYTVSSDILHGGSFQRDKSMNSSVLAVIQNTGPKLCVQRCLMYNDCNGVNYNKKAMTCQLLNILSMDNIRDQPGSLFTNTSAWSLEGSKCWPNPCTRQTKCVVVKQNYPVCVKYATNCDSGPCKNGGLCRPTETGYNCICKNGYHGKTCTSSQCDSGPCENKAVCKSTVGGYTCTCVAGYYGNRCQSHFCDSNPCNDHGTCEGSEEGYNCTCNAGYFGTKCESSLCDAQPCMNGGLCLLRDGYFICNCINDYYGHQCQFSPCDSSPCKNGGTCTVANGGYKCTCKDNFAGDQCQNCPSFPCLNNGTCNLEKGKYVCACSEDYFGKTCDTSPCIPNPCENGAVCKATGNETRKCVCVGGYVGVFCEVNARSCVGHCGDFRSKHECQCDDMCKELSDCCPDYQDVCVPTKT